MNGNDSKQSKQEFARRVLRGAAGRREPDVDRLVGALPEILAEARRRRTAEAQAGPVVSVVVSLARTAIPRLAAAAATLVLAASFFVFREAPAVDEAQTDLEGYILTGEVSDTVTDVLLEAIADQGNDHG